MLETGHLLVIYDTVNKKNKKYIDQIVKLFCKFFFFKYIFILTSTLRLALSLQSLIIESITSTLYCLRCFLCQRSWCCRVLIVYHFMVNFIIVSTRHFLMRKQSSQKDGNRELLNYQTKVTPMREC